MGVQLDQAERKIFVINPLYALSLITPIQVNKIMGATENFFYMCLYPGY